MPLLNQNECEGPLALQGHVQLQADRKHRRAAHAAGQPDQDGTRPVHRRKRAGSPVLEKLLERHGEDKRCVTETAIPEVCDRKRSVQNPPPDLVKRDGLHYGNR